MHIRTSSDTSPTRWGYSLTRCNVWRIVCQNPQQPQRRLPRPGHHETPTHQAQNPRSLLHNPMMVTLVGASHF